MLTAFGDESCDQTKKRVFVVAALVGDSPTWAHLRSRWKERLGEATFHSADCEAGFGEFRGLGETVRHRLHLDLTQILAESNLMGYGSAIDLAGCHEIAPTVIAQFPDMPYYDCFIKTVAYLSNLAAAFVPRDKLEFIFDRNRNTQYNAGLLYDWITRYKSGIIERVSFTTREEPGIQAADLWARELMKRCDTHLFNQSATPRPQWRTIIETRRFQFKFTLGRHLAEQMEDASAAISVDHDGYEKWRVEKNLVDNLSNRFRYFAKMQGSHREDGTRI
jgi:hypothetical protein